VRSKESSPLFDYENGNRECQLTFQTAVLAM
jgi:hypothetical protein